MNTVTVATFQEEMHKVDVGLEFQFNFADYLSVSCAMRASDARRLNC